MNIDKMSKGKKAAFVIMLFVGGVIFEVGRFAVIATLFPDLVNFITNK